MGRGGGAIVAPRKFYVTRFFSRKDTLAQYTLTQYTLAQYTLTQYTLAQFYTGLSQLGEFGEMLHRENFEYLDLSSESTTKIGILSWRSL
jgi:hypothetical protein